jgi:hypothetical protein
MKRQICIGLVMFAVLMVLGASLSLAQGRQEQSNREVNSADAASAGTAWFIEEVNSSRVGEHISVAVHPETGVTYVSYYDAHGGDLELATHLGSGGNCGPNNSWECLLIDGQGGAGDVGQFNSIAIYTGTLALNSWKLGIAYYDATNYELKFAEYKYVSFPTPGYDWIISTIITGNALNKPGLFTSLEYSSSGVPHIAYYRSVLSGDDSLQHAYQIGSGGNCGPSNTWQCDTVNTGEGMGQFASLDLDSTDNPWIAYYDADAGYPRIARKSGGWALWNPVSQPPLDTGKHVSLVLDDDDYPHLAYQNVTSGSLAYAEYVGTGGNCGYDGFGAYWWQCSEIEDMGTPTGYRPMSIAIDEAGYPIIAYQDASEGALAATLKVARPINTLGPPIPYSGNCGPTFSPPPLPRRSWQCDVVDGGDSNTDEAGSVSLAVDPNGLATIAYHEHRFMLPASIDSLKVAYQRWPVYLPLVLRNNP